MLIQKIRFESHFSSREAKILLNHHTKLEKSGRPSLTNAIGAPYFISVIPGQRINSRSVTLVDHLVERTHKAHYAMLGTLSK
jgi:hypothetical protein